MLASLATGAAANPYAQMQDGMYAGNPMYGMQMQQAPMMGMQDKMPTGMVSVSTCNNPARGVMRRLASKT